MSGLGHRLRAFARDERGVLGIIFGLSIVPIIGVIGAATDYAMASRAKANLQVAADAAALAATRSYIDDPPADPGSTSAVEAAKTGAKAKAASVFAANINSDIRSPKADAVVDVDGLTVTTKINFSARAPTYLTRILGLNWIDLSGSATASISLPSFRNVYLVIDNSQSMGIAATFDGMNRLADLTTEYAARFSEKKPQEGCVFGCHMPWPYVEGRLSFKDIAHQAKPPIPLRIDIIRDATTEMVGAARDVVTARNVKFAIYTLRDDKATEVLPLTFDYWKALPDAARQIDLGELRPNESGAESFLQESLPAVAAMIPPSGNGATEASAKNIIVLMTDGMADYWGDTYAFHDTWAIEPRYCAPLKAKGTLAVLHTVNVEWSSEGFEKLINPHIQATRTNMRRCASRGWYFEGRHADGIVKAMRALFERLLGGGISLTE